MEASGSNSRKVFLIFILFELLIIITGIFLEGFELEALHIITRFSGRLSLLVFSLIFLIPFAPRYSNWTSTKPYHLFALIHGIHLVQLLFYVKLAGNELIPIRVAGGFLAYLIIFIMPYLVQLARENKLSSTVFFRINIFYFSYIWFIFFMSYLPRVMGTLPNVGGSYWEHVVLFIWVLTLPVIKIYSTLKLSPVRNA
jgi:hypothetical protein